MLPCVCSEIPPMMTSKYVKNKKEAHYWWAAMQVCHWSTTEQTQLIATCNLSVLYNKLKKQKILIMPSIVCLPSNQATSQSI